MDIISIIFIAFGLAMDAFAVSITSGLTIKHLRINDALKIVIFFGSFHGYYAINRVVSRTELSRFHFRY